MRGARTRHQKKCASLATDTTAPPLERPDRAAVQERLLEQIARGAELCRHLDVQLRAHPAPGLEMIIQLYRVLVLQFSGELEANPRVMALINSLIKPVMDWERLEEKRKDRQWDQDKYREQQTAREAARLKEQQGGGGALQPKTLEKIERELKLF